MIRKHFYLKIGYVVDAWNNTKESTVQQMLSAISVAKQAISQQCIIALQLNRAALMSIIITGKTLTKSQQQNEWNRSAFDSAVI